MRFLIGLFYTALVFLLAWRKRSHFLPPTFPILFLVLCSFAIDILCYFSSLDGLKFYPLLHLWTLIEVSCEVAYLLLQTTNTKAKALINSSFALFIVLWIYTNSIKGALKDEDKPLVIVACACINIALVLLFRTRILHVSKHLSHEWILSAKSLINETIHQLLSTQNGKIFLGLFCYNLLTLCIFAYGLISRENTDMQHSVALFIRNTFFLLAFLHRDHD